MYKNYSYNDMPVPVKRKKTEQVQEAERKEESREDEGAQHGEKEKLPAAKKEMENDDIILLAVALVLLNEGCDDKLLLMAIAYIFLSDRLQ